MGILTTAAAATEGKGLLLGLDASRLKVLDVADGVIGTARAYNGFVAQLADDDDKAFAAKRFAEAVAAVAGKIAAEPAEVQQTIVAFFDGMGFTPKATE
jgi:hypothetical protein